MSTTGKRQAGRLIAAVAASFAVALFAAGCGDSDDSTSGGGGGPGVESAKAEVADLMKPTTEFEPPGPPLKNVKSLSGKTVWYIPITEKVEFFQAVTGGLKTALGKAGVKLRTCSGEANPSATAACVNQAVQSRAGAIVLDALPIAIAAQAFEAAKASDIPVLVTDQDPPPPGVPGAVKGIGDSRLAYAINALELQKGIANWVIADSNGTANTLVSMLTDSPSTQNWVQRGSIAEFKKKCPDCTTTVSKIHIASLQRVPSKVSSDLIRNPDTDYVISEFDATIQPIQAGVQQAGFANKVKGASSSGLLSALQLIKSGRFLHADMGIDYAYQGWAVADQVFRMMLGEDPVEQKVPIRLFTKENIDEIELTPEAERSGEWYGATDFDQMFTELWGL